MKSYRMIVAGPRDFSDYEKVRNELDLILSSVPPKDIEIVSGGCDDAKKGAHTFTRKDGKKIYGVDGIGERYASENGYPVKTFDADWNTYGNSAGPIRNEAAAKYANHALVYWQYKTKGSMNIVKNVRKYISSATIIKYSIVEETTVK